MNPTSDSTTMMLSIINSKDSGVDSSKIYVSILGIDSISGNFGYFDFTTSKMVCNSKFNYKSGVTSKKLSEIDSIIDIPAIESARIYFAINKDFDSMAESGPSPSKDNKVLFDKIEFDTHTEGYYNINSTSVDFYAFSYTVSVNDKTVGFSNSRKEIIDSLKNTFNASENQQYGNLNIFKESIVTNNKNEVLRILAPKTMAITDWGSSQNEYIENAQKCSHFFDEYINNHCLKANREFSFYDKSYPNEKNIIYGKVSPDGLTLNLYTDKNYQNSYKIPFVQRPSSPFGNPNFSSNPSLYHNVNTNDLNSIDLGFMLFGNAGASKEQKEPNSDEKICKKITCHWVNDPALMAIMVSICRGVMHYDDGTTKWVDSSLYYQGDGNGNSSSDFPIFYYSKILHQNGINDKAYVLSYDDVYGKEPTIYFDKGAKIEITLNSLEKVYI